MQKTVFITCFHALISRNILAAGVLKKLVESGSRIVLVVAPGKVQFITELFGQKNVEVRGLSIPEGRIERLLHFFSLALVGTDNHIVDDLKRDGHHFKYYVAICINRLFSHFFFLHYFARRLFPLVADTSAIAELIEAEKPDLVFSTDVFYREDELVLLAARQHKVRSLGMVRSWDNTTTKGVLLVPPDAMVTPNEVLKDELVRFHGYPAIRTLVTGLPHYDLLSDTGGVTREQFLTDFGLNPALKTILFVARGKIIYLHDEVFLALFKRLLDANAFGEPVQFLVRLPPADVSAAQRMDDSRFVIDNPGRNVTGRKKESELTLDDNIRLNNTIRYTDVMVTLGGSTMAIDGAVHDRPVISLEFDPAPGLPDSVLKFRHIRCFRWLIGSGPMTVSRSEEEFVAQIKEYLENPQRASDARERTRTRYAGALDGRASERVVNEILKQVGAAN